MTHVTKETAILLKEKGFDVEVVGCYEIDSKTLLMYPDRDWNNETLMHVSAPELWIVTEWLRSKGVHVVALPAEKKFNSKLWIYAIFTKDIDGHYNHNWTGGSGVFPTHDQALEAGIIHALKNYVK